MKAGENVILLLVHYIGEDFLTGLAGKPFVKLALSAGKTLLLTSDDSWMCCADPRFRNGLTCKVTPLEPGFARFEVKPYCGQLTHASGEIPTPHGSIKVSWILRNGQIDLEVEHPAETCPEITGFEEFPIRQIRTIQKRSGV